MSFEPLPANIETGVLRFAKERHLSHDEAVLKLIETGLEASSTRSAPTLDADADHGYSESQFIADLENAKAPLQEMAAKAREGLRGGKARKFPQ